jgi:deoxyribonuclease V
MRARDHGGVRPKRRQRWDLTPCEAIALQKRMRSRLIVRGGPPRLRNIAGADVAYDKASGRCFAAVVVMHIPTMKVIEEATTESQTSFPYVPGLLTFREGPALLAAFAKLRHRPDLIMFDGHGLAHPRRFGLASHMGYILDIPSIGCAKSLLVGEYGRVGSQAGSFAWLIDRGERVGAALRTRTGVRPIYVSPGHRVGFRAAIRLALLAVTKYRVPEPTRLADILVERMKRESLSDAHILDASVCATRLAEVSEAVE